MKKKEKNYYWQSNPYWKYKNVKNVKIGIIDKFGKLINSIISQIGIKVIRLKYHQENNVNSFLINKKIYELRNKFLSKKLEIFFSKFNLTVSSKIITNYLNEFDIIYKKWGSTYSSKGGMGYNNSLLLYMFVKILDFDMIIESGVARGFTTFIIDNAINNKTKFICLDVNLDNIEYKSSNATYFENDIENINIDINKEKTLVFFDDHMSHLDRLKFIKNRDIKYVIFDDDLSVLNMHSDGWPPLPSLNMIRENFELFNEKKIEWKSNNRIGELDIKLINKELLNEIKKYVDEELLYYQVIPELFEITGYRNSSQTSFAIFK